MPFTTETALLSVVRYRDAAGLPTCAGYRPTGDVCEFLAVAGMCGKYEVCTFGPAQRVLERRGDGFGTLIPRADCPVWKGVLNG